MPKKEGAGGKPQEYDADSGQYGDGTSSDTQKDKSGESGKPKTSKKKKLCVDTPEATELYDAIKRGEYRDAEQLRRHPTVRELDEMAHAYTKKIRRNRQYSNAGASKATQDVGTRIFVARRDATNGNGRRRSPRV